MKSGLWWKIGVGIVCIIGFFWIVKVLTSPAPGVRKDDLGREHVSADEVEKYTYNSNPPTSGPHLETWVKAGIYEIPQLKGELLHSLEHGYVEIHYNCEVQRPAAEKSAFPYVFAAEPPASPSGTINAGHEASGSGVTKTDTCKTLQRQLSDLAKSKRLFKLIVVPNPTIDTPIALVAWDYIETLNIFDAKRITAFIDYHRDHGPEQTME